MKNINEDIFKQKFGDTLGGNVSFGKKTEGSAYISVEFHYVDDKSNKLYFIEIESDNKAKIDVGEYVLLNMLYSEPNEGNGTKKLVSNRKIEECCFVTVICHKDNSVERLSKVLELVQDKYNIKLKHKCVLLCDFSDKESFLSKIRVFD